MIKENIAKLKEKLAKTDYKKLIGTKAFITVGCIMLVCAAILVSTIVNRTRSDEPVSEEGKRLLGNAVLVDALSASQAAQDGDISAAGTDADIPEDDFFAMTMINRNSVRDSQLDLLRGIADDPGALADARTEALDSIAAIADEMTAEANIETLVEAKGIAKCVAVISGSKCSVVVDADQLTAPELAQITDIVREQAGISVPDITVVTAAR